MRRSATDYRLPTTAKKRATGYWRWIGRGDAETRRRGEIQLPLSGTLRAKRWAWWCGTPPVSMASRKLQIENCKLQIEKQTTDASPRVAASPRPRVPSLTPDPWPLAPARRAFTLVEMLVSTALVLMMMVMFATVFQLATGAIGTQRGIAENDQRARTLTTVVKNDLSHRTFRNLIPFAAGEDPNASGAIDFSNRKGYFYISENDPDNDADDVLQFTADTGPDEDPFFGRATRLDATPNVPLDLGALPWANLNQPEWDDGQSMNGAATSRYAEISYFIRNGNLYRRVLLIRDPLEGTTPQPADISGDPLVPAAYAGNFWNDFDYSAYFSIDTTGPQFHGVASLDNETPEPSFVLGKPYYRFGHSHLQTPLTALDGQPREYLFGTGPGLDGQPGVALRDDDANGTVDDASESGWPGSDDSPFIGRFTQQETSSSAFLYPGQLAGAPMAQGTVLTLNSSGANAKVVQGFEDGPRRSEDILLSNVFAFDVKVWDDRIGDWENVGHADEFGDFGLANRQIDSYGPGAVAHTITNRVFDTWHRALGAAPPYRPRIALSKAVTSDPADTDPWAANTNYTVGTLTFPTSTTPPFDAMRYVYRCIRSGTSGPTAGDEPAWPTSPGQVVTDGTVQWITVDNAAPLKAIQITVRFHDRASDQVRQLTVVQSLTQK